MKKQYLQIVMAIWGSMTTLRAQDVDSTMVLPPPMPILFDSMPNAIIYQDSTIKQMMEDKWIGRVRGEIEVQGWRLQIYSSNNQLVAKQEAEDLKMRLESQLQQPIYVDFFQPFWKVRIGNFRTVEEAKQFKEQLIAQFPELQAESYPVRDIIKIKQ